jgi:hypothetical protein
MYFPIWHAKSVQNILVVFLSKINVDVIIDADKNNRHAIKFFLLNVTTPSKA